MRDYNGERGAMLPREARKVWAITLRAENGAVYRHLIARRDRFLAINDARVLQRKSVKGFGWLQKAERITVY